MGIEESIEEFLLNCVARGLSDNTIHNYSACLDRFQRWCEKIHVSQLEHLRPPLIRAYIFEKKDNGRAPAYLNDILRTLRVWAQYCRDEGYITELFTDRCKNVKMPQTVIRAFTAENVRDMIEYYSGADFLDIRNRLILVLLFGSGIRSAELRGIRIGDVSEDSILIHGKGGKDRYVPVTPSIDWALARYLPALAGFFTNKKVPDFLILNRYGRQLEQSMLSNVIKQAAQYGAHVSPDVRVSPHTCRHTYAQMQVQAGIDIYTLSRLLGHTNIGITQRYLEGFRDSAVLQAGRDTEALERILKKKA